MSERWGSAARAALDPGLRGRLGVVGGPGTGKSSLLVDVAAARVAAGVPAESVLLLTGAGRIGIHARSALTRRLLQSRAAGPGCAVIGEPVVRTVHSYAFAVLRRAALRAGAPPPRLVTSAEQDAIIADLLSGDLQDGDLQDGAGGSTGWPAQLRPALATAGFAAELRDLLARCAERGVQPRDLQRLGRIHGRPEWTAAGQFARQYEQVMLLRAAVGTAAPQATMPALGAAELVGAALEAFAVDPELLAAERARIRVLLVDDAQQLDPQAARLVRALAAGTELALVAADPNQAVFGFRGAEPGTLLDDDAPSVTLTASQRCAPAVARAVAGIARRLPGGGHVEGTGTESGSVQVRLAASAHAEAALIADALRRAHLVDSVPWSQMAVIVRSVRRAAGLSYALSRAGVPVATPAAGGALWQQPAARALLTVLAATVDGLDGERALALVTGPVGGVDPVSLRQLRRTLRRLDPARDAGDLLVAALRGQAPTGLPPAQARPLRRVRATLDAAARCHRDGAAAPSACGADPRATLWAAWHRCGLQRRWLTACARGGPAGAQAGRDLDAVTALFDVADQYVSRTAGASLRGFLDYVAALRLPPVRPEPTGSDEVSLLSAHAALGHEWDFVVIAGLQEGLWPNTIPRGGVLATQRLLDVLDGVAENVSMRAPLLAEERRLLVAAMGRARRRLLVTAVDGDGGDSGGDTALPSPFVAEIAQWVTDGADPDARDGGAPRVLSATAVVGRLRSVVCAPLGQVTDLERRCAATQLARLAKAGVPGADPAQWWGMMPVSTAETLWSGPDHVVTLTPSSLQTLIDCPLRWLAERHGGTDGRDLRATIGSVLHALIAQPDAGEPQLLAALEQAWRRLPFDAQWYSNNELARHRGMVAAFLQWRAQTRQQLTEVGVEVDVDGVVETGHGDGANVRLRGRVDRVERDAAGRLVVVDVKTGKTPVTKDDAQRHAQLAAYQLAVAEGLLPHGDVPGGALLVYPGRSGPGGVPERQQDPLTPQARDEWRDLLRQAAAATAGPVFVARINDGCPHCPMRPGCPAHGGVDGPLT
ncbi:ATP-dependent DNA helicase [Mycobacterium sp.]|uniref:ATP-dependent DNA helicase n=1 Tax=Mycobacterium sp. TaxID=1785 RepID=UPI0031E3D18C